MATAIYTVIGDLVGSRGVADRSAVQDALHEALHDVNAFVRIAQPFEPTVGDEYQGACGTLADAALAGLLVRLSLLPMVDSRCGIGYGEVTVHDAEHRPVLQDGPGWWSARAAIEHLGERRSSRRTWFSGGAAGPANAFLTCRDQLVERLNGRGRRMLRLALLGRSQKEIAEAEDIWPSAVSQQFSRGIGAIVEGSVLFADAGEA